MKRFLMFLIAWAFFVPVSSEAVSEESHHWVCSQVGTLKGSLTYAISSVFIAAPSHYDDKEAIFEKLVLKQSEDGFRPEFQARCYDFRSDNKVNKFLKKKIEQAKKRKFQILWIKVATNRQNH